MDSVTVEFLFNRLALRGEGSYGLSQVTQLEHALQCAALAGQQNMHDDMIIASLFHDIGHLVYESDVDLASRGIDDRHEQSSAELLNPLFGEPVSQPIRLHVAAKRYLCSMESDYYEKLSEDSRVSLEIQGGLMSETELEHFQSDPYYQDGVSLRRIDDQAKVPGLVVPSLNSYRKTADRLAREFEHS